MPKIQGGKRSGWQGCLPARTMISHHQLTEDLGLGEAESETDGVLNGTRCVGSHGAKRCASKLRAMPTR